MPHTAAPLVMMVVMVMVVMVPPCTCLPLTTFTFPHPLVLVPPHLLPRPLALAYIHTPHNPLMKDEPGVVVIAEVEEDAEEENPKENRALNEPSRRSKFNNPGLMETAPTRG